MDNISKIWLCIGCVLKSHPAAYIGVLLGLVLVVGLLTYSAVTSTLNEAELDELQTQVCNDDNSRRCNTLLDSLLKHPTEEQKQRLKELIREAK